MSPSLWCLASEGSRTVPSATPSIALGNSISRSAKVIQEMRPSPSAAASWVLISAEICAAETPITAGPIAESTRRTPSSRQSKRSVGSIPIFARGPICSASCATPPIRTPQASAFTGGSQYGARNTAAPMIERLSSTGVKAGIANRRNTFSTPPAREISDTNRMYGNTMRMSSAVSSTLPGVRAKPDASA